MGSDGVEVPQQGNTPARVGSSQVAQDLLHHQFGTTIGVGWCPGGEVLADRHLCRFAIDRGGRAEHQTKHSGTSHRLTQGHGASNVVFVIRQWLTHAFADRLEAGEVQHSGNTMVGKNLAQEVCITDIALDK
ncbi:hypothetical protein D3C85_1489700 [compost metagenome]